MLSIASGLCSLSLIYNHIYPMENVVYCFHEFSHLPHLRSHFPYKPLTPFLRFNIPRLVPPHVAHRPQKLVLVKVAMIRMTHIFRFSTMFYKLYIYIYTPAMPSNEPVACIYVTGAYANMKLSFFISEYGYMCMIAIKYQCICASLCVCISYVRCS